MEPTVKKIKFRLVREGAGGTICFNTGDSDSEEEHSKIKLRNKSNSRMDLLGQIGVQGCQDSVGVYFIVDGRRCFCSNMTTEKERKARDVNFSSASGENIRAKVFERLKALSRRDRWNCSHRKFGTNLVVVCSDSDLNEADESDDPPQAWYIVQALRDFFEETANSLEEEAAWLTDHDNSDRLSRSESMRPVEWVSEDIMDNTEHRIAHRELELAWKLERLREVAECLEVDTDHSGFVVDHCSGEVQLLSNRAIDSKVFVPQDEPHLSGRDWIFHCNEIKANSTD